jgi:hypothetical protein
MNSYIIGLIIGILLGISIGLLFGFSFVRLMKLFKKQREKNNWIY